ncbi:B-4DMT family transporter [Rhodococcus fascians]|nr:B-4DMT family transporter [Rhodococcus fascians]MBY3997786.1 B-4DMT family transporter [Rhodococcus fascians]MBY4001507.1 B-4DMT family transporter [Rhodococcus fascians]MBY4006011.1 B-4DMT family transporter [Rhodococcus fascians]MBY4019243.1 B-4DMT family transporter [Rhodococcus fascians]
MTGWAVRGIGMALINVVARLLLGAAVSMWPLSGSALRWVAYALVVLVIAVWAGIDGIRDRRRNPDPDKGEDLTMVWLKAAVVGGLLAGLISWIIDFFVDFSLGQNGLIFELTSGAAFTILTVFVVASIAMFVGRQIVNREAKKKLATSDAERAHDRQLVNAGSAERADQANARSQAEPQWAPEHGEADTEVFSAVDADGKPRMDKRGNRHGSADGS